MESLSPQISILVPVYNVERYLEQCLESIVSQTYNNLQIIIIDDGSTDTSGKIIDRYQKLDSRIEVIHKENTGYGHSMNLGLKRARGDYVGIVESDDFISPNMYQILAEIAQRTNADVVKGANYEYTDKECKQEVLFTGIPCEKVICPREHSSIFRTRCHIWAAIYKRSFLLEKDIWFNETPGASYQDTAFAFKVWAAADTAYLLEKPLIYYRLDNAKSSVKEVGKVFCILDEINEIDRYIQEKNIQDTVVLQMRHVVAYFCLRWNFNRIDDIVRYAFWLEMKKVCNDIAEATLEKKYWDEELWEDFERFQEEPKQYLVRALEQYKRERLDRFSSKGILWNRAVEWHIQQSSQIIIYGAGLYGKKVFRWLVEHGWMDKVLGFAVTEKESGNEQIDGIFVRQISEYENHKKNALIIVAVREDIQFEILTKLQADGYENVIRYEYSFGWI